MAPYRLLILVLSLSLLLLTPSGAGATVHESAAPAGIALGSPASPATPDLPADDHPLFIATSPTAPDIGPPGPTEDGGGDAFTGPSATISHAAQRQVLLLLGGAPPRPFASKATPWPTGPPAR